MVQADREQAVMAASRIKNQIARTQSLTSWLANLSLWRATTAAFVVATIAAVSWGLNTREHFSGQIAQLQSQLQTSQQVSYVAVLSDNKESAAMLVTLDRKNNKLLVQRVGAYREASDKSLQLWALVPDGAPRSLGVLGKDNVVQLTAAESDVRSIPTLAISLEPLGGVPSATGPTGPVLFKGALIQKVI